MTRTELRDLPEDLVEDEILCRVPSMYLNRTGTTCKRWNRLFRGDERFERKHIDKSPKEFLVLTLNKSYRICEMSVDLERLVPSIEVKSQVCIIDPYTQEGAELDISQVFRCDGLLLINSEFVCRFAVWNPFTEEIKWFQYEGKNRYHCLGYRDKKSYKVLSFELCDLSKGFYILELSSGSARILLRYDVMPRGWTIGDSFRCVSLKGNTYMFAEDGKKNLSLLKFDYSTEKSVPLPLPYQRHNYYATGVSVVRDEKLSVLLEWQKRKTEIWVTNKISQSEVVTWSKILAFDWRHDNFPLYMDTTFLLDEEKKVVMIFDTWDDEIEEKSKEMIYIVGEDNRVIQVPFGVDLPGGDCAGAILNYVPSLAPIDHAGAKRKRL